MVVAVCDKEHKKRARRILWKSVVCCWKTSFAGHISPTNFHLLLSGGGTLPGRCSSFPVWINLYSIISISSLKIEVAELNLALLVIYSSHAGSVEIQCPFVDNLSCRSAAKIFPWHFESLAGARWRIVRRLILGHEYFYHAAIFCVRRSSNLTPVLIYICRGANTKK